MSLRKHVCRRTLVIAAACFALSGAARADDSPKVAKLGTKIPNITFGGVAGKTATLYDFQANKAIVVVVLNFDCPNSTGYAPALAELCRTYTDKGVAFLGLCPSEDDATTVGKKAAEYTLGFPVYKDDRLIAVKALKATTTPEAFVLDQNFVMRYRGRIDSRYSARLKKNLKVGSHDLRNALEELLAGKVVSTPVTPPIGCPIFPEKTVKKDSHVTYYRDVLPILQNHCQVCHRPGQAGPFSLMTYPQAVKWSTDIKRYTQSRAMPPWKITEGVAFHNERRLSNTEIATLAGWVDGGTPAGDPTDAPKPKEFAEDWMLGKPDLVVSPKEDFILGPSGPDLFHCYTLPTSLPEDKYVIAIEVKPGNRRVVHHTLNFIDTTGQARRLEDQAQQKERDGDTGTRRRGENDFDRGPGYTVAMGIGFLPRSGLGGWAPGQTAHQLPEGYGWLLPKSADVVLQVHYHRDGRVEKDRTQIGLYFAKKADGMKPYKGGAIAGQFFAIPAGNDHFVVKGSAGVLQDCELHTIMPHMHLLGRQIKVTLKRAAPLGPGVTSQESGVSSQRSGVIGPSSLTPDSRPLTPVVGGSPIQLLLNIEDWDYNWQETYFLKTPLKLKAGDRLEVEAVYDNSDKNPNNPNHPPRAVTFGQQSTNEMCFAFLGATSDGPGRFPFQRSSMLLRLASEQKDEANQVEREKP